MYDSVSKANFSLSDFFNLGKMDIDFVLGDHYVIGICVMYPDRSAQEDGYMIREKSVVEFNGSGLSSCVQEAKDLAYQAAISRLSGIQDLGAALAGHQSAAAPVNPQPPKLTPAEVEEGQPDKSNEDNASRWSVPSRQDAPWPPADDDTNDGEEETPESTEPSRASDICPPVGDISIPGTPQKFDLSDLQPASFLLQSGMKEPQNEASEPSYEDSAYEKALKMKITIVGKLHACYGKSAGDILDQMPDVIVEYAHKYNGPKVEERDALKALYTEALRRVNQAA